MKAYLVLDLSVNDFSAFRKYIAEIPAFIAKHSGKYIVQGRSANGNRRRLETGTYGHHRISSTRKCRSISRRPGNTGLVQGAPRDDDEQTGACRWVYVTAAFGRHGT
jgi:hypothetical protein